MALISLCYYITIFGALLKIVLAVVYGLYYSSVLGGCYLGPTSTKFRNEVIVDLGVGLIGAVAACYLFYRKGKPQDVDYEVIEIIDLEE